jgi:hypothetical protein
VLFYLIQWTHNWKESQTFYYIRIYIYIYIKLHGLSPRVNYTDRATAACRRSDCQLLRKKGATSLRPYSRFSRQEPLLFYQVAPQLYSRVYIYIYIYLYICVCVCVCVCKIKWMPLPYTSQIVRWIVRLDRHALDPWFLHDFAVASCDVISI